VLAAWGIELVQPLPGGQGDTFTSGDLVLKPALDEREAAWLADVLDALPRRHDLRVIRPVRATDGRWVVEGWVAFGHLAGAPRPGDWRAALDVSDRFHDLVAQVPWSPALDREHAWAVADAFAWGERDIALPPRCSGVVERLCSAREPVDEPSQLVHGDLCNNILFHDDLSPAVIDISPFWRPRRYADAIAIVDAIAWFGAGGDALEPFADRVGRQLLVRAVVFRLASAAVLMAGDDQRLASEVAAHEPVLRALDL
jgi:uncharacterized protein (TIGR02569 family)